MFRFFSWDYFLSVFPRILGSAPVTLAITAAAFAVGILLAILLAAARLYRIPVANQFAIVYISFMRGTPILVQLLICNMAIPGLIWKITGINVGRLWPLIVFVVMAYALNTAAFLSEIFRSSVSGVDSGQREAAYSVGMTAPQSFIHVIFPQAIRIAIPGAANTLSSLLKDTSLAYGAAGIFDIMGMANASGAATYRFFEGYAAAGIIFFGLYLLLELCITLLSRRMDRKVAAVRGI